LCFILETLFLFHVLLGSNLGHFCFFLPDVVVAAAVVVLVLSQLR